jgi:hypothetical protein
MIDAIWSVGAPALEALPDFRRLIAVSMAEVWPKQRCHV